MIHPHELKVLRHYNVPGRFYHTVSHVLELLELHEFGSTRGVRIPFYRRRPVFDEWEESALRSAIVAHDAVYEIGREKGYNERASFDLWRQVTGLRPTAPMELLVEVTIHHDPNLICAPSDSVFVLFAHMSDLDMSALAADWDEFEINSENICREFLHGGVSLADYTKGRIAFLKKTLAQPRIYHTDLFHEALENTARNNMRRALQNLGAV